MGNAKARRQRELATAKLIRQAERRTAARRRRRRVIAGVTVGALVLTGGLLAALLLISGNDDASVASPAPSASPSPQPCMYTPDGRDPSRPVSLPATVDDADRSPATMVVETNLGTMTATLDAAKAPCTVHALRTMAEAKYFDDTPCHRQTGGPDAGIFVLQCGDPTGTGTGGPGVAYANENTEGVTYNRGVIAMANSGPDTNGSQFFINYADPSPSGAQALAGGYTVVGTVTEGLDVLDALTSPGVEGGGGDGAPASGAHITSITITQGG